jgi:hypothetical protein
VKRQTGMASSLCFHFMPFIQITHKENYACIKKKLFKCKQTRISKSMRGHTLGSVESLTIQASMLSSVFHSRHLANIPQKTHSRFFVSVYITRFIHKQYYTPEAPQSLLRSEAHVTRVPTYPQLYSNQKATMNAAPSQ